MRTKRVISWLMAVALLLTTVMPYQIVRTSAEEKTDQMAEDTKASSDDVNLLVAGMREFDERGEYVENSSIWYDRSLTFPPAEELHVALGTAKKDADLSDLSTVTALTKQDLSRFRAYRLAKDGSKADLVENAVSRYAVDHNFYALRFEDCGDYVVEYTDAAGLVYQLSVQITLPQIGMYTGKEATEAQYIKGALPYEKGQKLYVAVSNEGWREWIPEESAKIIYGYWDEKTEKEVTKELPYELEAEDDTQTVYSFVVPEQDMDFYLEFHRYHYYIAEDGSGYQLDENGEKVIGDVSTHVDVNVHEGVVEYVDDQPRSQYAGCYVSKAEYEKGAIDWEKADGSLYWIHADSMSALIQRLNEAAKTAHTYTRVDNCESETTTLENTGYVRITVSKSYDADALKEQNITLPAEWKGVLFSSGQDLEYIGEDTQLPVYRLAKTGDEKFEGKNPLGEEIYQKVPSNRETPKFSYYTIQDGAVFRVEKNANGRYQLQDVEALELNYEQLDVLNNWENYVEVCQAPYTFPKLSITTDQTDILLEGQFAAANEITFEKENSTAKVGIVNLVNGEEPEKRTLYSVKNASEDGKNVDTITDVYDQATAITNDANKISVVLKIKKKAVNPVPDPQPAPTTEAPAPTTAAAPTTVAAPTTEVPKNTVTKGQEAATRSSKVTVTADKKGAAEGTYITTDKKQKKVTVPKTVKINGVTVKVTALSDKAFENNKKLTSVTVSDNIRSLGKNLFVGCKNLKNITITSTKLTSVKKGAFKGLSKKTTITVPKKMYKKYKKLFKKAGLPNGVKLLKK